MTKTMGSQTIERITVTSPYSGHEIGSVPALSASDIDKAIANARRTQPAWGGRPLSDRLDLLRLARGILLRRAEDIARLIASEQGKPVMEAMTTEIVTGLDYLSFCVQEAPRLLAELTRPHRMAFMAEKHARVAQQPRGVTSILSPWNFPFAIPFCQIAACLAVGNTVLLRPSTSTPLISLAAGEVFAEAGVPPGVLQVLPCRTHEAEALVTDPRIRLLIFTGSTEVGRELGARAAKGLCRTVLELGGKDPFVVFEDAPLERAARGAVWSAFMNAGQTCSSTERVYVQRPVLERFTARIVELACQLTVGDPLDPDTEIGPMTTEDGVRKVTAHVDDAVAKGARVLTGGRRGAGRVFPPTVLADVTHDMLVMREETFGPLLPIMAFDTEEEALRLANASEYGLTASIWTSDLARARRMEDLLEAGHVTVNDASFTFAEGGAPWGGVKNSGLGRTHGPESFADLVDVKYISEDWSTRDTQLWWYPYDSGRMAFFKTSFFAMFAPTLGMRVSSLLALLPSFPLLAREANLPQILGRIPQMLMA